MGQIPRRERGSVALVLLGDPRRRRAIPGDESIKALVQVNRQPFPRGQHLGPGRGDWVWCRSQLNGLEAAGNLLSSVTQRRIAVARIAMELGAQRHAGSLRRARIAVLNDDTTFLQLIEELLEQQADYEVATWKNWHGAYEFVKQPRPDLVILDIVRGHEEHGWTVHNLLTLDPETRPIPVLVCSAAVQSLQAHQALLTKLGICALPKPFDLNALLETIRQRLAQHGHEH